MPAALKKRVFSCVARVILLVLFWQMPHSRAASARAFAGTSASMACSWGSHSSAAS